MKLTTHMTATLVATCGLLLAACPVNGDDPEAMPDIADIFPADDEVAGWSENGNLGSAGVEVMQSYQEAWDRIDGDAEFFEAGMAAFAIEFYTNGAYDLEVRVWEMQDAPTCTDVYETILTDGPSYSASQWTTVSLGEAGRVADGGSNWWYNCRKKVFEIEAYIQPRDDSAKPEAEAFLKAMLDKIP